MNAKVKCSGLNESGHCIELIVNKKIPKSDKIKVVLLLNHHFVHYD